MCWTPLSSRCGRSKDDDGDNDDDDERRASRGSTVRYVSEISYISISSKSKYTQFLKQHIMEYPATSFEKTP